MIQTPAYPDTRLTAESGHLARSGCLDIKIKTAPIYRGRQVSG